LLNLRTRVCICCGATPWLLGGAACAEAGDATTAMAEYEKMRAEGCKLDRHVFAALIAALGSAVCGPDADRRMQLVLLERAFQLLDDMKVRLISVWGSGTDNSVMPWGTAGVRA
jgi:Pentacotripeptide-repeat region of PRORP